MSTEAADEAAALVARFPTVDGGALDAIVGALEAGRLRETIGRRKGDYDVMVTRPVKELRIETTLPRLRLYFVERSGGLGVLAVGLLLATKPSGSAAEQHRRQDEDIVKAWERFAPWTYPSAMP